VDGVDLVDRVEDRSVDSRFLLFAFAPKQASEYRVQ
jgi:hypothetical protein